MSTATALRQWSLSSGACEALKWIALASMLVDHINTAFFGHALPWMLPVGRIAMPVFSLVLGYNMARPGADHARLLKRLLLVGLVSMPVHAFVLTNGKPWPLDVLFTFAAGVAAVMLLDRGRWLLAAWLLLVSTLLVDYTIVGVALLVTACWYFRHRNAGTLLALGAAVAALCWFNGNAWALYGVGLLVSACWWSVDVPRHRWLFWAVYPLHFVVLAGVMLATGS